MCTCPKCKAERAEKVNNIVKTEKQHKGRLMEAAKSLLDAAVNFAESGGDIEKRKELENCAWDYADVKMNDIVVSELYS